MNNRFPILNKHEKKDIDDGYYKIENFFKTNIYINLNLNNNQLYLKEKNYSINDIFEIKFQNDGTYVIKNIDLDIYLGISNIQLRDEFNIPLKEYYLKFIKNFEGINQKWYFLSNTNNYYYLVSAHNSLCVSNKTIQNNSKILFLFPNGKKINYLN